MLIVCFFLHIKSSPNLLFGVLCLPGDQSHPFAQPTINPLARCICWAGLLGRAVFPPWNEGPNFGSYSSWSVTLDGDTTFCLSSHKLIFALSPFPLLTVPPALLCNSFSFKSFPLLNKLLLSIIYIPHAKTTRSTHTVEQSCVDWLAAMI